MDRDDTQLISDYLEGDEKALAVLVERYFTDAYSFARKLTNDAQIAEDVTQESFTKAWKNMRKFIPGKSFRGWLFTIIRNTAIDILRKKKEILFSSFEADIANTDGENMLTATLADEMPLPDELLARAEDAQYVAMLLEKINPDYKEVLTLKHEHDMTFTEIGELLQKPLHTVKSQYRRGLTALRRLLEAQAA